MRYSLLPHGQYKELLHHSAVAVALGYRTSNLSGADRSDGRLMDQPATASTMYVHVCKRNPFSIGFPHLHTPAVDVRLLRTSSSRLNPAFGRKS
jgi:hypothetical protein